MLYSGESNPITTTLNCSENGHSPSTGPIFGTYGQRWTEKESVVKTSGAIGLNYFYSKKYINILIW